MTGNHEAKLVRALRGRDVTVSHGLAESLAQLAAEPAEFTAQATAFMDQLLGHLVLDDGRLVVAHAGLPEAMHGRASAAVRSFALYGDTSGETDEFGLPVRYPWAQDYRGRAMVAYGHTPVPAAEWVNGTICLDTGCVFGGRLTALRYPEREIVSVPARQVYFEPVRPLAAPAAAAAAAPARADGRAEHRRRARQADHRDPADRADRHHPRGERARRPGGDEPVRPRPALAGLPAADHVAAGRRRAPGACWSIRARPSPPSGAPAWPQVVAQEKHMGSRAVVIACRDRGGRRRGVRRWPVPA